MRMPKKLVSIAAACTMAAGLAGILGCVNTVDRVPNKEAENQKTATYFATVPMRYESGIAVCTGDFDGNGTLDIIVASEDPNQYSSARLYLFKNDGKGNFYQDTNVGYGK
ncbi:VCBS repeat-containing protein [Candidatus Woesearchaeota archaeon]|nr:VCBS repeat-containing protein [Candidatus Woesearchaeota archaeon]